MKKYWHQYVSKKKIDVIKFPTVSIYRRFFICFLVEIGADTSYFFLLNIIGFWIGVLCQMYQIRRQIRWPGRQKEIRRFRWVNLSNFLIKLRFGRAVCKNDSIIPLLRPYINIKKRVKKSYKNLCTVDREIFILLSNLIHSSLYILSLYFYIIVHTVHYLYIIHIYIISYIIYTIHVCM